MAINCYYINNNSFHGLQISNLNTQELLMHDKRALMCRIRIQLQSLNLQA